MGLISNGTTIFDAGAVSGGGSLTFIKKLTASTSATLSFVHGASSVVLDGTYKEYLFTFNNIHPGTNNKRLTFNMSIDSGSNYNVAKTSSYFYAFNFESADNPEVEYNTGSDLAQGTGFQMITTEIQLDNDGCSAGFMQLFNPSSTTFVKHFIAVTNDYQNEDRDYSNYSAGYGNTTSAVNAIQFKMNAGNIDAGDICLYGIS
jgi:hypothetical protein